MTEFHAETTVETPLTPPKFHPKEGIFALLTFVFAFLFWKYTVTMTAGIALTITTVLFVAFSYAYAALKKRKIPAASFVWAAVIMIFALVYTLSANDFLKGWCAFFEFLAIAYWIFVTFGNRETKVADDLIGFDLLKTLILLPFGNLHQIFLALKGHGKNQKVSRTVLFIFLGFAIAFLPAVIVYNLLISGDAMFSNLIDYLFEDVGNVVGNNFGNFFFGIPFGMLLFGLLYGAAEQKYKDLLTRSAKDRADGAMQFASPVITCAALTPMLGIYILFFVSQMGYFMGAFQNIRPENYTYAEYAREGFFNLCAVCVVNAVVILAVNFFTKRNEKREYSVAAKIYIILFSLSSVFLAVIALRKMVMYIEQYGLTLSRVYASWFMILLSVFFLLLIIKQFFRKFNVILAGLMAFVVLFGGLCLWDVDATIADYNLNRYITAENKETVDLDLHMFHTDLSHSAIVQVYEVYDELDEKGKELADQYFEECASDLAKGLKSKNRYDDSYSFRSWNKDTAKAEQILRQLYPEQFKDTKSPYGWTW